MNIEGQNLSSSYRKIRTRMLRYPCRLVADQKERQVPTVSLWLCFGFPRKYQGKEASYVLEKEGDDLFWCDELDGMLEIVAICVPRWRTYHWGWGWEDSSPCCSPASWRRGRRWRCCGHGGSP